MKLWVIILLILALLSGPIIISIQQNVGLALVGWEGEDSTQYVVYNSWCKYPDSWNSYQADVQMTKWNEYLTIKAPEQMALFIYQGYKGCEINTAYYSEGATGNKPCISVVCEECPSDKVKVLNTDSNNNYLECIDPCVGLTCDDYCSGKTLFYDGRCIGGTCAEFKEKPFAEECGSEEWYKNVWIWIGTGIVISLIVFGILYWRKRK